MLSWALRHRLGLTVSGAGLSRPMYCLYASRSQTTLPLAFLIVSVSGLPMKPRVRVLEILPVVEVQYCCTRGWRPW